MKHSEHKITILVAVALAVLLSGCGGGSQPLGYQSPYTNEMYPTGTVINGYTLPPEPDHGENDKTLLGIDVNHNGMRDDVERYIIIEENQQPNKMPKTWTSLQLQYERGVQYFWRTGKIDEVYRAESCQYYVINLLEDKGLEHDREYDPKNHHTLGLIYNTKKRDRELVIRAHNGYYPPSYGNINDCDDNITAYGELP
jgi:hypothetical protein